MRVEKWDILMHRLLTEKKEKEEKASKSKGSKPDFLDLDKDGDTSEPMKKASKESGGKKETKPKKGKGKIPPQLKMHIKKKKNKLDEAIERLEKILLEEEELNENPLVAAGGRIAAGIADSAIAGKIKDYVKDKLKDKAEEMVIDAAKEKLMGDEEEEEDKKETSDQADNEENKKEKEDEEEKEDVEDEEEPEEKTKTKKKKEKSFRYLEPTHKNISDWWKDQTSLEEAINRLEKILKEENKSIKEYGKDKHPDIEDDDDDFDADDLPSYGEEDFGDYDEESMRKFAQKSKDFADKYTEEDDYEEEEEEDYEEEEEEEDYEDEEDMEDEEEDFEEEELEESEELDSTEANIEKIDREDYRRETANTDQSVELDELIEALKGTKFESMQCLDPSRYSQVIKFTEGPSDGSFILPMKKTDDYLYFKTNEKSNGVYYKIPLAESEEEDEEYLTEAEVKKKQPRLGKVTRNPSGSKKKFHVYVKCGGRVKKISFGDPGLSIKRDSAARRKNFRARHKCDQPAGKDRCTARYWSCYQWRAGKKVEGEE